MSVGKSESESQQSSSNESRPLSADEVAAYFNKLNDLSGGRLDTFAKTGTTPLTEEQLKAIGGAGATRTRQAEQARREALDKILADPSLSLPQRQRATQLSEGDYADRLDAISKETEAAMTNLAAGQAALPREDLHALAQIFFGGKGQRSTGSSSGSSDSSSFQFGSGGGTRPWWL